MPVILPIQNTFSECLFETLSLPVAIIWSRPYGQNCFVKVPFKAFHDQLMGPANHVYVIGIIELCNYIRSEQVAGTSRRYSPANCVCVTNKNNNEFIRETIRSHDRPTVVGFIDTERSLSSLPSGSLHSKSHMGPSCGTSCLRSIVRI